jgi:hypothetical protein
MSETQRISKTEIEFYLREKKTFKSPDVNKMQMVEIDKKTKLYIAMDASADDARKRYMEHQAGKKRY